MACFGKPDPSGTKIHAPLGAEAFNDAHPTENAQAERIVVMLRDADAMRNARKNLAAVMRLPGDQRGNAGPPWRPGMVG